ncbi:MAG: hypothetical protein EHM28_04870 [Spirochaetaceae bacterium]|nr:MAG: hypothetical protein EHM28_04870 [Spirochaetaceae bacterium]
MDLVIFSNNRNIVKLFKRVEGSCAWNVSQASVSGVSSSGFSIGIKKRLAMADSAELWYIDAASFTEKKLQSAITAVASKRTVIVGVIDAKGIVVDIGALFSAGAGDYLGPKLCKTPVRESRLFSVIAWKGFEGTVPAKAGLYTGRKKAAALQNAMKAGKSGKRGARQPAIPALSDWASLQSDREYVFTMMYIELDGYRNLGQRVHEAAVERLLAIFQKVVEQYTSPGKGRLWIWNDFGGIVLFPYGGKPENVIIPCMRLMLSRRLVSVEQSGQKLLLSYRIVLYPGSTVYRERGKTGRIISDAVNSLSHIGQKYAKPGNMYITQDLYARSTQSVREGFKETGTYEGTVLYRMRLPIKY